MAPRLPLQGSAWSDAAAHPYKNDMGGFLTRLVIWGLVAAWLSIAVLGTVDPGAAAFVFGAVQSAVRRLS